MAEARGIGGGVDSISESVDGVTTDAYVVLFTNAVPGRMLGIGTIKNVGAAAATGNGVFPDPSAIAPGVTFTLDDGVNPAVTFEFVKGGPPAPGNVAIDIAVAVTADHVRDDVIIAIL